MKACWYVIWILAPAGTLTAQDIVAPLPIEKTAVNLSEEPPEFSQAMDLYQARKYIEARETFRILKKSFQSQAAAPNNYSTLAGFYEMECSRRLGDFESLGSLLAGFDNLPLIRNHHRQQLDLYPLWLLVKDENWLELETASAKLTDIKLPGDQRAQVAYCHAIALEGLNRPTEALAFYHTAITADAGGSEEITRQAVLRILQIHLDDPAVKAGLTGEKTFIKDENQTARHHLQEAKALARLYVLSLGGGAALPPEFRVFLTEQEAD